MLLFLFNLSILFFKKFKMLYIYWCHHFWRISFRCRDPYYHLSFSIWRTFFTVQGFCWWVLSAFICLGKSLFLYLFYKDFFFLDLWCWIDCFSILNMLLHCLLTCVVSDDKSVVILFPSQNMWILLWMFFKIFFTILFQLFG